MAHVWLKFVYVSHKTNFKAATKKQLMFGLCFGKLLLIKWLEKFISVVVGVRSYPQNLWKTTGS